MSIQLSDEVKAAAAKPDTIKVLSSVSTDGIPHVVFKGSIRIDDDGQIRYFEILESSQTNKNLTASVWFEKQVAISLLSADKDNWQIKGVARRAIISGPEFEQAYVSLQERFGTDIDLSTIWVIDPLEERVETLKLKMLEEREKYPLVGHLDRFT